jgi:polar amino acid transport system substrate-binding protein
MALPSLRVRPLLVATLLAVGLAACGSGSSGGSPSVAPSTETTGTGASGGGDAALAAMVPDAVKADGTITVGTDATYAPSEFLDADGKTVVGFDVDVFNAVAARLGLKTEWVSAPFDNIIPSVLSGKYEIGVSSFTINADRMKQVDMVSYFSAGTQWATQAGNPQGVQPDAACGKKVAVQKATVQVDDVTARSKTCTDAGKPAIGLDQYQGQDTATAAVVSNKDDAMLADSPVIAYAVQQTAGKLELLGDIYDSAPYGYVIKKDQGEFGAAVSGALAALIADGTYKGILDKWGVSQGAIDQPTVNPTVG